MLSCRCPPRRRRSPWIGCGPRWGVHSWCYPCWRSPSDCVLINHCLFPRIRSPSKLTDNSTPLPHLLSSMHSHEFVRSLGAATCSQRTDLSRPSAPAHHPVQIAPDSRSRAAQCHDGQPLTNVGSGCCRGAVRIHCPGHAMGILAMCQMLGADIGANPKKARDYAETTVAPLLAPPSNETQTKDGVENAP